MNPVQLDDDPATSNWPEMARAVNTAAKKLQVVYGNEDIPAAELQREAERLGGYKQGSVCPSDYCYDTVNRASFSFVHQVLVRVGHGRYKHLGPNHSYNGPVFWKPKGSEERQVGLWQDGVCKLMEDPRK